MIMLRVTIETESGFVIEIGQYESLDEALYAVAQNGIAREMTIKDGWSIKMKWVDSEVPY